MRRRNRALGGGGSSASAWTQLTAVEQASNAVSDPGAFTAAGTQFVGGDFTWVMAGDILVVSGYQTNWAGWSYPLLSLYPDFDPDTDELELGVEVTAMPLSTAKYGLWFGVTDSAIDTRASITAAGGVHVFPNSAVNTNGGLIAAAATGSSNTLATSGNVTDARGRFRWLDTASPAVRVTADCSRSTGGDADIPGVAAIGASFGATLANWRVVIGHVHLIATTGTPTLGARLWHRRLRTAGVPFPDLSVPAKPTGGEVVVAIVGHSFADGYGGTGASTTIPASTTVIVNGTPAAVWPSGTPNPNRGIAHELAVGLLAQGYSAVRIYVRATSGAALTTIRSTNWTNVVRDMAVDGRKPHLVVVLAGENDMQAGESTAYAALIPTFVGEIETYATGARVLLHDPPTTDLVGYPEQVAVAAAHASVVAARPTRGLITKVGVTLSDTVHPGPAGYDVQGGDAADLYDTVD